MTSDARRRGPRSPSAIPPSPRPIPGPSPPQPDSTGEGIYHREGPNPASKAAFYRECSFRWFSNSWKLALPVFPERHNETVLRANLGRHVRVRAGGFETLLWPGEPAEKRWVIPAEVIGQRDRIELRGESVARAAPGERDKRELVMTVDWVRWRNHKILEVAYEFRDRMREANPGLAVTCNCNIWPFGNKDWDTGIPMWATDEPGGDGSFVIPEIAVHDVLVIELR